MLRCREDRLQDNPAQAERPTIPCAMLLLPTEATEPCPKPRRPPVSRAALPNPPTSPGMAQGLQRARARMRTGCSGRARAVALRTRLPTAWPFSPSKAPRGSRRPGVEHCSTIAGARHQQPPSPPLLSCARRAAGVQCYSLSLRAQTQISRAVGATLRALFPPHLGFTVIDGT